MRELSYIPVPLDVVVPPGMVASWAFIPTSEAIVKVTAVGPSRRSSYEIDSARLKNAFSLYRNLETVYRLRKPLTWLRWHERLAARFVIGVDALQARFNAYFGHDDSVS